MLGDDELDIIDSGVWNFLLPDGRKISIKKGDEINE
jgi:hypothetical protein